MIRFRRIDRIRHVRKKHLEASVAEIEEMGELVRDLKSLREG